jgi:YD repeat-containing protein
MTLGSSIAQSAGVNPRLQPTLVQAGSLSLTYTYGTSNNNGNVQTQTIVTDATRVQSYGYDPLNRLSYASESGPGAIWTQNYVYDWYGNRAVRTDSTLPNGAFTPQVSAGAAAADVAAIFPSNRWTSGQYDPAGNLVALPLVGRTFTYDAENRMVNAMGSWNAQYAYDGDGRRVQKTDGYGTTVYVYDAGGQLAAEYFGRDTSRGHRGGLPAPIPPFSISTSKIPKAGICILNLTLREIQKDAKQCIQAARKVLKLLKDTRFGK